MASYTYTSGGYKPQENTRYEVWEGSHNGVEPHSHGWGKTGFANNGEGYQDHVCRPVIIDAYGRKRPLIACDGNHNMEGFVTKTETFVEQVHVPQGTTIYASGSPTEMGVRRDYGVPNNGWNRPVSPSRDRPSKVDDFFGKVQAEASRPSRTNLVSSMHWGQKPNSDGYGGTNGYGGHGDNSSYTWNKPSVNTIRDPYFDASRGRNQFEPNDYQDPPMNTTSGWTRPSRAGWATPPSPNTPLSRPTNDIGTAIEYLKEATNPSSVTTSQARRFTVPTPIAPKLEKSPTIDSREARRKYGSLSAAPQPVKTGDYSSAVDSREAARRYGGHIM